MEGVGCECPNGDFSRVCEKAVGEETDERRLAPTLSRRVSGQFSLISEVPFPGPQTPLVHFEPDQVSRFELILGRGVGTGLALTEGAPLPQIIQCPVHSL